MMVDDVEGDLAGRNRPGAAGDQSGVGGIDLHHLAVAEIPRCAGTRVGAAMAVKVAADMGADDLAAVQGGSGEGDAVEAARSAGAGGLRQIGRVLPFALSIDIGAVLRC